MPGRTASIGSGMRFTLGDQTGLGGDRVSSSFRDAARPRERAVQQRFAPVILPGVQIAFALMIVLTLAGPAMTQMGYTLPGIDVPTFRQAGYLLITILGIVSLRPITHPDRLLVIPWPILAALGWCWLSVFWAIEPGTAFKRVLLATMAIWLVFAMVRYLGYQQALLIVRIALIILLVMNWVTVELYPEIGTHRVNQLYENPLMGDWRGLMAHKNIAGLVCALTVLMFLFDAGQIFWAIRAVVIAAAALFLYTSSSRTSLGVCIAAVVMGFVFAYYRARYRKFAIFVIMAGAVAGAFWLTSMRDAFEQNLQDPAAFTGRTQIWAALYAYFQTNPIFGAGYGSFWTNNFNSPIFIYGRDWVTEVYEGHNGYLDLLVQVGIPGLLLVLFAVFVMPWRRLLNERSAEGAPGALIASILVFMMGHNGSESSMFDRDSIGNVFLMLAIALLWTLTNARRPQRSRGSRRPQVTPLAEATPAAPAPAGDAPPPRRRLKRD